MTDEAPKAMTPEEQAQQVLHAIAAAVAQQGPALGAMLGITMPPEHIGQQALLIAKEQLELVQTVFPTFNDGRPYFGVTVSRPNASLIALPGQPPKGGPPATLVGPKSFYPDMPAGEALATIGALALLLHPELRLLLRAVALQYQFLSVRHLQDPQAQRPSALGRWPGPARNKRNGR